MTDETSQASTVITFGETLGLFYSTVPGAIAQTSTVGVGIGGAESNVAIALRRLGIPTTWVGRVGRDSLGDRVARELRAEGVNAHVIRDQSASTGLMIKERRTSELARVWYYRAESAGSRLTVDDLDEGEIAQARLLHVTGITPGLSESAAAATRFALRAALAGDTVVSFDLNHRTAVWGARNAAQTYREIAAQSTILFAGEREARMLVTDARELADVAEQIALLGPSQVILKLGAQGAFAHVNGENIHVPAIPVQVIDTVGAGDAFVAGYLADYLEHGDALLALRTAIAAGAFACMSATDWEGSPTRDELVHFEESEQVRR
jgi:2-dehydro-3-deoxygluconokinase